MDFLPLIRSVVSWKGGGYANRASQRPNAITGGVGLDGLTPSVYNDCGIRPGVPGGCQVQDLVTAFRWRRQDEARSSRGRASLHQRMLMVDFERDVTLFGSDVAPHHIQGTVTQEGLQGEGIPRLSQEAGSECVTE